MKILASILILLFGVPMAFACTCTINMSDAEHSKYLKQVKAIFYGEVISLGEKRIVNKKYRGDSGDITVSTSYQPAKFKVLQAWKGIETNEVFVETDAGISCSYTAQVGNKVMVYAYENKDTEIQLFINHCSMKQFDNEKMKFEYGVGKVFEQPKVEQTLSGNNKGFWAKLWVTIASFFS